MSVTIKPADVSRDMRTFFNLSGRLYRDDTCYVEPLRMSIRHMFDKKKNAFFEHASIQPYIAFRNGKAVGRICAIHNRLYNELHGDGTGFFGFFDCMEDREAADLLYGTAESWLRDRGLDTAVGPMSFSTNDLSPGFLVSGFQSPPFIEMTHCPPYYAALAEEAGYEKACDVLAFRIPIQQEIDRRIVDLARKVKEKRGIRIRYFDPRHFDRDIAFMKDIYNSAWEKNWGFVPFTDAEFDQLARDFNKIKIDQLAQIAEVNGVPAGFSLTLPNINEALIHMNGRLFPFGFVKYLWWSGKIRGLRMLALGIKPEFRKRGVDIMLYYYNMIEGQKLGYATGELSWVLETNTPIITAARYVKGEEYKRYRIFRKRL